jgi:putative ABC transport system permease protein
MEVSLPEVRYPDPQKAAFFAQLLEKVRGLPGVASAGAIGHLPLAGEMESYAMQVQGGPPLPNEYANPDCHVVEPGYFESMGIPLVAGRYFDQRDGAHSPHALIINEAVVRNVFPNENPLGRRLAMGFNGFTGEIVGVVGNTKHLTLDLPPVEEVYTPYPQAPFWGTMVLTIRTTSSPLSLSRSVRDLVQGIDSDQPISKIRTMDEVLEASVAAPRFRTLLLGLFGLAALFLGALGIYGVMSYSVSQRTREIGIRIALGAARPQVTRLVLKQGLELTLAGLAIGLVGALGLTHLLASMLYEVRTTDPMTFVGVAMLLTAVALLASYIPARRATKVDPMVALRYE